MKKLRYIFFVYSLFIFCQLYSQLEYPKIKIESWYPSLSQMLSRPLSWDSQTFARESAGIKVYPSVNYILKNEYPDNIYPYSHFQQVLPYSAFLQKFRKAKSMALSPGEKPRKISSLPSQDPANACFVSGTPVLSITGLKAIDKIELGNYIWSNESIANISPLIASLEDEFEENYLDPWASADQLWVDNQNLKDEVWYRLSLEMEHSKDKICILKLLRPKSWISKYRIGLDTDKIWISMPEQGIEGYARVTSLAYYHFNSLAADADKNIKDDMSLMPVTGIFIHESRDVWRLEFRNLQTGELESLGVSSSHPIFSLDYMDWRLAAELGVGENVLTGKDELSLETKTKLDQTIKVYNLEVRKLHNFMVGNEGIVVHNSCLKIK